MTTVSSKRNSKVPALSGGRKPRQNIRAVMPIVAEELHKESPKISGPNDHVEGFITPADEKCARVGWISAAHPPGGGDGGCA
uniref:Uncharacterized protein n=1 Tax=Candidatus Kentrum sp. LPFa TaxID=2126335 RepID=A0A450VV73_9GAMM|nr:MAG: hypothetical protein BECKLPF1236B_GA0070989_10045 [Candidatus Kentron sp. LPFa]